MLRNGLLLLSTANVHCGDRVLSSIIETCVKTVRNLLYVHLVNCDSSVATDSSNQSSKPVGFGSVLCTQSVKHFVSNFYITAANVQRSLEVRFLLSNICSNLPQFPVPGKQRLQHGYEVVLTDLGQDLHDAITNYVTSEFPVSHAVEVIQLPRASNNCQPNFSSNSDSNVVITYPAVCLGGTFDRMHVGHHILLSEACMLATHSVTIGVTDGPMNNKKVLSELLQPISSRLNCVHQFVSDIKPSLQNSIVPITDPFGPAVTDPQLECIVVSNETVLGANSINVRRVKQGMKQLAVQVIDLVADPQHAADEEEKISSSSARKQLLGTLLRPPLKEQTLPYIIGLTGGTASGKSSICTRLEHLGAVIIDCDKLGHKSYEPGTPTYQQVLSVFGDDMVTSDGHIDRRRLAKRVFSQKDELEKLNGIVWPAIRQFIQEEVSHAANSGYSVVVLDAAVLLAAGWDDIVHEVWTTLIPADEAVRRLMERNGIEEEEALRRVKSHMSNEEWISRANVVLCTLWHTDITQKQVEKAWRLLQSRLNSE